jgi:hypothetical protein
MVVLHKQQKKARFFHANVSAYEEVAVWIVENFDRPVTLLWVIRSGVHA